MMMDSPKTVLIPAELYEKGDEEHYLRFNGMTPGAGDVTVATRPQDGIVAVMAVSREEWELHIRRGGAVASPLLSVADGDFGQGRGGKGTRADKGDKARAVNILLTETNFYFAVWYKTLRMAEVLPENSVDSILYYLQVLSRQFKLSRFDINIDGHNADAVAAALRRYYPRARALENYYEDRQWTA
ncbi:MAG: DUF3822 family protein [Alistipes sp.]|jgi:hypothetical protein|nr:DUF3822 family protein [Alistipes sp.]